MTIEKMPGEYAVCRLQDRVFPKGKFTSLTVCGDEISLVCESENIPSGCQAETGWSALRIAGTLDFSLVGILAGLTAILAKAGVSVFAISTYNTDYIFVKKENLRRTTEALTAEGHTVTEL